MYIPKFQQEAGADQSRDGTSNAGRCIYKHPACHSDIIPKPIY